MREARLHRRASMFMSLGSKHFDIVLIAIGIAVLVIPPQQSNAQGCCTPGTSTLGGVERGVPLSHALTISLSYQNNNLKDAFEASERIEDPLGRTASVEHINLELEYGLANQISIMVATSYYKKKRELTVKTGTSSISETVNFSGAGFGDVIVLGKYQIVAPTILSAWELSIGGGAKLPIGDFRQAVDGTRLSIDLQPGTGAPDLFAWGFVMRSMPAYRLRLYGNALYRYSGTNMDNYRFGDEILLSVGAGYGLLDYLDLSLLFKGRFAKQDYSNGRILQSTGSRTYSIMPNIIYYEDHSALRLFAQFPFYRNVNGLQLTLSQLVGMELLYFFQL